MKNLLLLFFVLFSFSLYADTLNFHSRPMSAGKASLTENAYIVSRLLDTANFSPELRLPVQLVYKSSEEKTGLFGFAWRSPQLESMAYYDKDGVLWVTPWGEKIKFFPKREKTPKDAIRIELYEEAKKGRGFYAPYSDWEADSAIPGSVRSGDWVFSGKRDRKGWTFVYSDCRLKTITAPSGRSVEFIYNKDGRLISVSQDGRAFIELKYSENTVSSLKINGIDYALAYRSAKLRILPKTEKGKIISASRPALSSIRKGDLDPVEFTYDSYGFLNGITQGDYADKLVVQHQTPEERRAELEAKKDSGIRYEGSVNGRIVSDSQFKYVYPSLKPGAVSLVDQLDRKADYALNIQTGIFRITEFSGRSYTVYYFMRHDAAYLGKVRKIVDGRGRDMVSFYYDRLSGSLIRARDMAGNDINFEYGRNGSVSRITRRAAGQHAPEPVRSFTYDHNGNLTAVSTLDAEGKAVVTTSFEYARNRQVSGVSDGQSSSRIVCNRYGYPVSVTNVFGQTVTRTLDKFNRTVAGTDFHSVGTSYAYTPAGLISRIERRDGAKLLNSLAVTYDGAGRPVSYTDQSGRTKKFGRDAFGRVVKELFPDDTEVAYTYNKLGQLQTVLDQNKHQITFDWNQFGLDAKTTPAGQLTDYVRDKYGLLAGIKSKWNGKTDRSIKYEYDQFDRIIKVDYGNGNVETRAYDTWGRLTASSRNGRESTFRYDYFGRLIRKTDGGLEYSYAYNSYGRRTARIVVNNGVETKEFRTYDKYGRLKKIVSDGKTVEYVYNDRNQIQQQIIDGKIIEFAYGRYGQLKSKRLVEK